MRFFEYTKRTRFLLQLYDGTSYLNFFIGKYEAKHAFYRVPNPQNPVIIVLDNDSGCKDILNGLKKIESSKAYNRDKESKNFKSADFIYVVRNLYVVLTPLNTNGQDTAIEDLFDAATRNIDVSGKRFNPSDDRDLKTEYGKAIFAKKVVQVHKTTINFSGLRPLLNRMVLAIEHYDTIK